MKKIISEIEKINPKLSIELNQQYFPVEIDKQPLHLRLEPASKRQKTSNTKKENENEQEEDEGISL